jgi:integrase
MRGTWDKAVTATGINPLFHDLRRTRARNMRKAGVSEGVIMEVGGWKTRSIFDRYDIKDENDLHEEAAKLNASLVAKGKE